MKISVVFASIFLFSLSAVTYAASFYGDDKYEIVETPMTWSEADAYAKSKGAILVKIETAEQNTWLKDFLKTVDTTAADGGGAIYSWLGGTDSVTEGAWLWGDGTQVPLNDSASIWWGNGSGHGAGGSEPDNFNGTQHCLAVGLSGWPSGAPGFYGTAGQWNDVNCTNKLTFAIQYPSAKIPQLERDALVALYNSTDGANWKDNTGWMGEVGTECLWYGVTCESASVTRLSIANNSLTGTIPSELGNLADLNYLYLGANSLNGNIPKELGNLTNLSYLHIGNNSLSGSIPKELGNLTKLTGIYLFSNDLTGAIPQEWIDIKNVNYNGNLLVGQGLSISSVERDALVALYNSTDGANWKDNTGWMGEVGTECRWYGVTCLSASVTQLSLFSNSLTGTIPSELGNLINLEWLSLYNNSLSGTIPSELGSLTNLNNLYLHNNSLSGTIPGELGNLTNLDLVVLNNNSLSGSIPTELGGLTKARSLSLSSNSLSGEIPAAIGNLTSLKLLNLNDNSLSGSIPSELGNLTNLTSIVLHNNSLSGSIPIELGSLTNLTSLYASNNSLSGTIPSELGSLSNLELVYLQNNSLSGSIPTELGGLVKARNLHLSNNSFSGSIPSELGSLTNLEELYLYGNSLSGSIPSELGNLTNLIFLRLDDNSLSGNIPSELGSLANLIGLYLKNNSLSGSIPSELGSLTSIEDLELDFNSLSGSIPSELGGLTSLVVLGLENNSLSGSIPSELGNLTNLTWLTLNNNSLSGSIPAELGNLSNLKYLWLAVNSLTGNIPSELGNLTKLSELTLSNNNLTGAVPSSLNAFNIKSSAFKYEPTDEWPSPYNGVTPNASLGLAFNNIGFFRAADATLYVCLRVFTDGLASSVNGVGAFDIGMKIFSLADATIQITKSREFNTGFAFNEKAKLPDCSGKFETTTGVYTDIIQTDTSVLETTWSLIDPVKLILKLESSKDLTAE